MKYNVIATERFERSFKHLAKKYKSLSNYLSKIIDKLETEPTMGTRIG